MKRFLLLAFIPFAACSEAPVQNPAYAKLTGETQGTTFAITYSDSVDYTSAIDSIFKKVDNDLSLWVPGSLLNRINSHQRTDTVFAFHDSTRYFSVLFDVALEIWSKSNGAFDPTVRPLIEYWGFGFEKRAQISSEGVDSVLQFTGFRASNIDMIEINRDTYFYEETQIRKGDPRVKIDFNAIAQGFTVDLVSDFLVSKGVENFMVEIGGEVNCRGVNPDSSDWRIAIDQPIESDEHISQGILRVKNRAVATSGSYRKFYEENGQKFAHIIDPRTGYPVNHNLLSATVVASNAMIADAYATAFLVMGVEGTLEFLVNNPDADLQVILIYSDGGKWKTYISEGLKGVYSDVTQEPA